ncbi:MAG: nucleoside-diphosphate-sugar epimerase [Paracoccaceae bacterium]|jgi:nucleoside-diphosphate-sugar epimerase
MHKTALVIGGAGPTGQFIVNSILERGYKLAILHAGNHQVAEIPPKGLPVPTKKYSRWGGWLSI